MSDVAPREPPPTPWVFPDPRDADDELVGVGADLEPGTVLAAYRRGLFPMPLTPGGPIGWWSPDPRGVLEPANLRVTRSLRRSCRRYRVTVDVACAAVIDACADPTRPHGWIDERIRTAYLRLHQLGWVHSVETWDDEELVGGLYGVSLGGLFAGESMFHRRTDASKVALVALIELLTADGVRRLVDVQWVTPHLASLGAVAVPRSTYVAQLAELVARPHPLWRRGHPSAAPVGEP